MKIDNPAFDYDSSGKTYSSRRETEPKIAEYIYRSLGDAKTVLNVGAGAGSYEPEDRYVVAIEPSATMRSQRLANGKTPAINASADHIPFDDMAFDAVTAFLTIHHWPDIKKGLSELQRVAKRKVVIMTFDPEALDRFWNAEYFPEVIAVEKQRYPTMEFITATLGDHCEIVEVPVPLECVDGFQEAFYGRPEAFLDKQIRLAQSAWGFIPDDLQEVIVSRLANDLASGAWDRKYGHFRSQAEFVCALRLVIWKPED
jgi:SAM-dependent methyltransferase